jgi:hypothetical protein
MDTRTERQIVFCTVIAVALSCALPAAADSPPLADTKVLPAGMSGRALSAEEMGSIRGRYLPPGSTVAIQIGTSTSTTYYQRNPYTPGSATVTTSTGGTTVTGSASTTNTSTTFTRTFSTTRTY